MTTQIKEIGFFTALLLVGGCTDRTTTPSGPSSEELKAESEKLCNDWIAWQNECREDLDFESLDEALPGGAQELFNICMDSYFESEMAPCREVAIARLKVNPLRTARGLSLA